MGEWRRGWVALALLLTLGGAASADDLRYLRIGTGPAGESHFPMGGLIASALSSPPGSRPCERGGTCGVPGLIAVASSTTGSVANVQALGEGRLDLALVQADIGMWAYQGVAPFVGHPMKGLRAVAVLYPDLLHLVTRADANIHSPRDLRGKRVSLGEKGSGTLIHARQVLAAWGMSEDQLSADYVRSGVAADEMTAGKLDAFFVLDGIPVPSVTELAKNRPIRLVPIIGPGADKLRLNDPLLQAAEIPAGTYPGVEADLPTLGVGVSLVVSADLPEPLVYALCKSLWNPITTKTLAESQPQVAGILLVNAITRIGLPLHPGAERFYHEQGMTE
jgi:hypothetical protein